jgi:hypothetical protein
VKKDQHSRVMGLAVVVGVLTRKILRQTLEKSKDHSMLKKRYFIENIPL